MNSDCRKMKEWIADSITGILPDSQLQRLEGHLSQCSDCKQYADTRQKEEQLVAEFFSKSNRSMGARQDRVILALSQIKAPRQPGVVSFAGRAVDSTVARRAFAAAVILVVAVYFTVTLTWISQINLTCRSVAQVLKLPAAPAAAGQR